MSAAPRPSRQPREFGGPSATQRVGTSTVVVGFDGSVASFDAVHWACGEASRLQGRVVAVYVAPRAALGALAGAVGAPCCEQMVEQAREEISQQLEAHVKRLQEEGFDVELVSVKGSPADELVEIARATRADLLVVGRSQHALHHLAGSIGRALAGRRDAPVVVVVP